MLARGIGVGQTYLCAIEAGRKDIPRDAAAFVQRISEELDLSAEQANELLDAAILSRRKHVIPLTATVAEFRLINKLMKKIGTIKSAQVIAIAQILEI